MFDTPGSSPLTRGKPLRGLQRSGPQGLIPAHAGKTMWPGTTPRRRRAHPRSRGENARVTCELVCIEGSSPLTRGKRGNEGEESGGEGLIPAHAGKT